MYVCENWTIKKAEHQRINAFKLWCWRRLLRVLWTARRSNQSILKEINSEYSLEGLMLKLQYFGHLMWRADSLEKTLMLGKFERRKRRGWQRIRWLDDITNSIDISLSKAQEIEKDREAWCAAVYRATRSQTWLRDWTATPPFPPSRSLSCCSVTKLCWTPWTPCVSLAPSMGNVWPLDPLLKRGLAPLHLA